MTFYYETAPLPGLLGWWFHRLPAWFHKLESRLVLALELLLPFAILGPRKARLVALVGFSGFQLIKLLTANYGFFCYLSLALHVFLLEDRDLEQARAWLARRPRWASLLARWQGWRQKIDWLPRTAARLRIEDGACLLYAPVYLALSASDSAEHFHGQEQPGSFAELRSALRPLHLINTYHLFGHITRERIEAEFQTQQGETWSAHHLHYKPGEPTRWPSLIAPHQPRIDFQRWFHGLSARRGEPPYVSTLLDRMCHDPAAVQPLFAAPLPASPQAVRVVYSEYHFTSSDERSSSGAVWRRIERFASPVRRCKNP